MTARWKRKVELDDMSLSLTRYNAYGSEYMVTDVRIGSIRWLVFSVEFA